MGAWSAQVAAASKGLTAALKQSRRHPPHALAGTCASLEKLLGTTVAAAGREQPSPEPSAAHSVAKNDEQEVAAAVAAETNEGGHVTDAHGALQSRRGDMGTCSASRLKV